MPGQESLPKGVSRVSFLSFLTFWRGPESNGGNHFRFSFPFPVKSFLGSTNPPLLLDQPLTTYCKGFTPALRYFSGMRSFSTSVTSPMSSVSITHFNSIQRHLLPLIVAWPTELMVRLPW